MSRELNEKEQDFIHQKAKEIKASGGISYGLGDDKQIIEEVTASYLKQREALKFMTGIFESPHAGDKLARYEAAARGDDGSRERKDRDARLSEKISKALSGSKVGFGDIKRITEETTLEFEQEERFKKMKF